MEYDKYVAGAEAIDAKYDPNDIECLSDETWPESRLFRKLAWTHERMEHLTRSYKNGDITESHYENDYDVFWGVGKDVRRSLGKRGVSVRYWE